MNRIVAIDAARRAGQRGAFRLPDAVLLHGDIDPSDSMIIERLDALEEGRRDRERTAIIATAASVQQSHASGTYPAVGERRTPGDGLRGVHAGGVGRVVCEQSPEDSLTLGSVALRMTLYLSAAFGVAFMIVFLPVAVLCAFVITAVVCPVLYAVRQFRRWRAQP